MDVCFVNRWNRMYKGKCEVVLNMDLLFKQIKTKISSHLYLPNSRDRFQFLELDCKSVFQR